jgi:hypothetical protein
MAGKTATISAPHRRLKNDDLDRQSRTGHNQHTKQRTQNVDDFHRERVNEKRRHAREIARTWGRCEWELNKAIERIAHPPAACRYCYDETGEPFPDATHHTCPRHQSAA